MNAEANLQHQWRDVQQPRVQQHPASTQKVRSFCGLGPTRRTETDAKDLVSALSTRPSRPQNPC
jgi:hypothetical protein